MYFETNIKLMSQVQHGLHENVNDDQIIRIFLLTSKNKNSSAYPDPTGLFLNKTKKKKTKISTTNSKIMEIQTMENGQNGQQNPFGNV